MLSKEFGMIHLSAGELLRAERQSDSSNGNLIESYLKEGRIVPVQITLDLLRREVLSKKCNRYLIDGFPRNWDNIQGWESTMPEVCDMEAVLFIDCPENVLEDRILNRGLTSGRSDDNVETVRKRFATYRESTIPILQHYAGSEKLFRVRGDQSKDEVFNHLKNAIIPLVKVELMNIHSYLRKVHVLKDWDSYKQLCDIDIVTSLKTSQVIFF
jgi:UMP-CMP kinase